MATTLVEVKNQVISHFVDKTVFNMVDDSAKIQLDENTEQFRESLLRTVLNDLELTGMVKRVGNPEKELWILTQSFDSFNQSVVISAPVADIIADMINSFRDENDITGDVCDKLRILERDFVNLINICHVLLDVGPSNPDDMEEEKEE